MRVRLVVLRVRFPRDQRAIAQARAHEREVLHGDVGLQPRGAAQGRARSPVAVPATKGMESDAAMKLISVPRSYWSNTRLRGAGVGDDGDVLRAALQQEVFRHRNHRR